MKKIIAVLFVCLLCGSIINSSTGYSDVLIPVDGLVLSVPGGAASSQALPFTFYNPASALNMNARYGLKLSFFPGLFESRQITQMQVGIKLDPANAAYLTYTSIGNPSYDRIDEYGALIQESAQVAGNSIIKAGYVRGINENLSVGAHFTYFTENLPAVEDLGTDKRSFIYGSLGAEYKLNNMNFGLSAIDIIPISADEDSVDPSRINLTAGARMMSGKLNLNLLTSVFISKPTNNLHFGIGGEYVLMDMFYLRLGYLYTDSAITPLGLNAGVGVKYKDMVLDYNFSLGEYGNYNYFSLGFSFGGVPEKAAPRVKKRKPAKPSKQRFPKAQRVQKKYSVAIMSFESSDTSEGYTELIADFISDGLVGTGRFTVIERSAINLIMQEMSFQKAGCTSAECAVKVGKILAVNKMIVGKISLINKIYYIRIKLVDVETSRIEASATMEVKEKDKPRVDELIDSILKQVN
ncbi:hypothetical protein KAI78_10740 [bacterium]|nr:hypothetical protein [bacterium]